MSQPQVPYEQQFKILADEHRANGDPTVFVFDTYLRWKGVPQQGARLQMKTEQATEASRLSRHFSVLQFPGTRDFKVYGTLGASRTIIPGSEKSFDSPNGVRYEYLIHSKEKHFDALIELLLLVAEYPYKEQVEVQPGFVLPIGEPVVDGSGLEFLYFTYPYVDDTRINEANPWGQIDRPPYLIHFLWVLPIYLKEFNFLRRHGMDAFEERINRHHRLRYDGYDFMRKPYV
jgi:hypothetical protein